MPSSPLWEAGLVLVGALPQTLPADIDPQPSPVVGLIAEALGLRFQVLDLVGWKTTLVDVDGHSFLEGLNIRYQG